MHGKPASRTETHSQLAVTPKNQMKLLQKTVPFRVQNRLTHELIEDNLSSFFVIKTASSKNEAVTVNTKLWSPIEFL
jgi:hypothetical protein